MVYINGATVAPRDLWAVRGARDSSGAERRGRVRAECGRSDRAFGTDADCPIAGVRWLMRAWFASGVTGGRRLVHGVASGMGVAWKRHGCPDSKVRDRRMACA